jgi:type IV secretion system protein VirD4
MALRLKFASLICGLALGLTAATHFIGWAYRNAPALGPRWTITEGLAVYPPWAFIGWHKRFGAEHRREFNLGLGIMLACFLAGAIGAAAIREETTQPNDKKRGRGWARPVDARKTELLSGAGCVIGELNGRLITTQDLRPTLVTGGTRSGKGRGHVGPTLLNWTGSVLVHDPKGENFTISAGWRGLFSHTLRFAPRSKTSARFNPLAEIPCDDNAIPMIQRIVTILADPSGRPGEEIIWDTAAREIVEAVILDTLYTAPDPDKNLITVKRRLADLDKTAEEMVKTLHRPGPGGEPETHPFIRDAGVSYIAMHDRFRTSVQGTARSYLKWLAGPDIERAVSMSDFRLGDLMCAEAPMSLYVQVSLADSIALKPLVRLIFYAAGQMLTADEKHDAAGRPKKYQLLLVMDEFPMLGRIDFFEKQLRLMSSYGLKAMFVAQSLNDIVETYGTHNGILDNCFIYSAFAALDPLTQDKVSRLTGIVTETREGLSEPQSALSGGRRTRSLNQIERPLLEPGEVRGLPDDTQISLIVGRKPFRLRKVQYDKREPFKSRAAIAPPAPDAPIDAPSPPPIHPWAGKRALGFDADLELPLFKEMRAAMAEKDAAKAAERVSDALGISETILGRLKTKKPKS